VALRVSHSDLTKQAFIAHILAQFIQKHYGWT